MQNNNFGEHGTIIIKMYRYDDKMHENDMVHAIHGKTTYECTLSLPP